MSFTLFIPGQPVPCARPRVTRFGTFTPEKTKVYKTYLLQSIRLHWSGPPLEYAHRLLEVDPATEIVQVAESEQVDMIVMGTTGRTGISRLLLGSTAEQVLRHAPCPVLMVKQPVKEPAQA